MESELQSTRKKLILSAQELQTAEQNRNVREVNYRDAMKRASEDDRITAQDAMDAISNKGDMRGLAGLVLEIE